MNKMDLVGFDEARFEAIRDDFAALRRDAIGIERVTAIPVCALDGDNVTARRRACPGMTGRRLLPCAGGGRAARGRTASPPSGCRSSR